jgi:ABC-type antimicrobial peptide transport system permease subunit
MLFSIRGSDIIRATSKGFQNFMKRLIANKSFLVGSGIVAVLVFLTIFGPWIAPYNPDDQYLENALKPTSWNHP